MRDFDLAVSPPLPSLGRGQETRARVRSRQRGHTRAAELAEDIRHAPLPLLVHAVAVCSEGGEVSKKNYRTGSCYLLDPALSVLLGQPQAPSCLQALALANPAVEDRFPPLLWTTAPPF